MQPNTSPDDARQPVAPGYVPAEPAEPADRVAEANPRNPRRRAVLILLGGVALAALTVTAGFYGPTAWRIAQQRDARLVVPPEAAGLRLDDSGAAKDTADYLRTALAAGTPLADTVGAVYADAAAPDKSVFVVGGTATLRAPESDLDLAFRLLTDESGPVEDVQAVPAGELGGIMRCGTSTADDTPMAVCGWADHGSLAVAMFPGRTVAESAELLRGLRVVIEQRN